MSKMPIWRRHVAALHAVSFLVLLLSTLRMAAAEPNLPCASGSECPNPSVGPSVSQTRHTPAPGIGTNFTPTTDDESVICPFKSVSVNYKFPGLLGQCLNTRCTLGRGVKSHTQNVPNKSTFKSLENRSGIDPASAENKVKTLASRPLESGSNELNQPLSPSSSNDTPEPPSFRSHEAVSPPETPEDSPIDVAKFLSFEEWKAQNLAKVGQSSDSFSERGAREPRKAPGNTAVLDALGDEIELDFGFGNSGSSPGTIRVSGSAATPSAVAPGGEVGIPTRSKDAGKTCKERFNYASFDCAATVHKHNKEAKGGNSILLENKEAYMLNQCEAKEKFFIVELCEDILVDTIVLANFEFFSSVFKEIRVSVSDRYPVKANGWKVLGTYLAKNTRDVQVFLVENPLIWARYLKVDILSHYGNEFYCPMSLLRIHGTTMMEEFKYQEEASRGGFEEDVEEVIPEAVAEPILHTQPTVDVKVGTEVITEKVPSNSSEEEIESTNSGGLEMISTSDSHTATATSIIPSHEYPLQTINPRFVFPVQFPTCHKDDMPRSIKDSRTIGAGSTSSTTGLSPEETPTHSKLSSMKNRDSMESSEVTASSTLSSSLEVQDPTPPRPKTLDPNPQDSPRPTSTQPSAAIPTTQESFFKSVHKRLTHLEANSTLSLQYIEEQSRLMRDMFAKIEKSHVSKIEKMLNSLNSSAFADLRSYRENYEQLWQTTVLALESQRTNSEREIVALSSRLSLLADEIIFQKRMYQLNTLLLVVTICVVIFSRSERLAMPLGRHLRTPRPPKIRAFGFRSPSSPDLPQSPGTISSRLRQRIHYRGDSTASESEVSAAFGFGSQGVRDSSHSPENKVGQTTLYDDGDGSIWVDSEVMTPPTGPKGKRRSWMNFGPKLRSEKTRRWQRFPSPLAGGVGVTESNDDGSPGGCVDHVSPNAGDRCESGDMGAACENSPPQTPTKTSLN